MSSTVSPKADEQWRRWMSEHLLDEAPSAQCEGKCATRGDVKYWTDTWGFPLPGKYGRPANYITAHNRVRKIYGKAEDHPCACCGEPARHWAYDHKDAHEVARDGRIYSMDPTHYWPLCIACHRFSDSRQSRLRYIALHFATTKGPL